MTEQVQAALDPHRLEVLGGFAVAEGEAGFPAETRTLLMIGPGDWTGGVRFGG